MLKLIYERRSSCYTCTHSGFHILDGTLKVIYSHRGFISTPVCWRSARGLESRLSPILLVLPRTSNLRAGKRESLPQQQSQPPPPPMFVLTNAALGALQLMNLETNQLSIEKVLSPSPFLEAVVLPERPLACTRLSCSKCNVYPTSRFSCRSASVAKRWFRGIPPPPHPYPTPRCNSGLCWMINMLSPVAGLSPMSGGCPPLRKWQSTTRLDSPGGNIDRHNRSKEGRMKSMGHVNLR